MKRVLIAGALLCAGFLLALVVLPERIAIVTNAPDSGKREAPEPPPPDRTDEVLEETASLGQGLHALATALDGAAQERDALRDVLAARFQQARQARTGAAARLDRGLANLARQLTTLRAEVRAAAERAVVDAAAAGPETAPGAEPDPEAEPAPELEPDPAPAPAAPVEKPRPRIQRKSLAALLAARMRTDVRDQRTRYRLMDRYCRVGFDGSSTIHNFTASSKRVKGTVLLHLNRLEDAPSGRLTLRVDTLDSGNSGRDEEMHRQLSGGKHTEIVCEVLGMKPGRKAEDGTRAATARVRFTINGRSHELDAPVSLQFTRRRLLHMKGEVKLRMSDFDIHPKAKLGLIKVEDELSAWWDLYAEVVRVKR